MLSYGDVTLSFAYDNTSSPDRVLDRWKWHRRNVIGSDDPCGVDLRDKGRRSISSPSYFGLKEWKSESKSFIVIILCRHLPHLLLFPSLLSTASLRNVSKVLSGYNWNRTTTRIPRFLFG